MITFIWLFVALSVPVPAAADNGEKANGVDISQMDLLSGIPTLLVMVAGFIQIFSSPVRMFRWRIEHFVHWLQTSIERDFSVSLYSCSGACHTRTYTSNLQSIEQRIWANTGTTSPMGCKGADVLTADDMVEIIQSGNGHTLVMLAKASKYPHVARLETAVRVIEYAPRAGRRVIFWQWSAMSVPYFFSWIFRHGLPPYIYATALMLRNMYRRMFDCVPHERVKLTVNYRISDLAHHKIVAQHTPFVRYTLYVLLMQLVDKRVSVHKKVVSVNGVIRPMRANDAWHEGTEKKFGHLWSIAHRLAFSVGTDECAAANMLFACGLHSLRVVLLSQGGFGPPYVITSSFRAVDCCVQESALIVYHGSIDAVHECLLQSDTRGHYDMLLKALQSPLGNSIQRKQECQILLNMALLPLDPSEMQKQFDQPAKQMAFPEPRMHMPEPESNLEIEGRPISSDLYQRLCKAQCELFKRLNKDVDEFAVPEMYWGPHLWLLRMLRISFSRVNKAYSKNDRKKVLQLPQLVRCKIKMLCFSPYQLQFGIDIENIDVLGISEMHTVFGNTDELDNPNYCRSMPAWCLCSQHCRGICTLIVNELKMNIMSRGYSCYPYVFTAVGDVPKYALNGAEYNLDQRVSNAPFVLPEQVTGKFGVRLLCAAKKVDDNFKRVALDNNKSPPCSRFDKGEYVQSRLIYQNKPMLLAIYGDQLYKARQSDISENEQWPHPEFMRDVKTDVLDDESMFVDQVEPLVVDSDNIVARSADIQASLSVGRLKHQRNQETKHPSNLETPFRSILTVSEADSQALEPTESAPGATNEVSQLTMNVEQA
ncbi:hypothetical protein GGF49_002339 [Coemansia sp. RSA 1853]|nr:hypothetical protein GGF49_002339 [Coemansia sp. RSA 1853]